MSNGSRWSCAPFLGGSCRISYELGAPRDLSELRVGMPSMLRSDRYFLRPHIGFAYLLESSVSRQYKTSLAAIALLIGSPPARESSATISVVQGQHQIEDHGGVCRRGFGHDLDQLGNDVIL